MTEFWIIAILIAVLGVPFTLWWWKLGMLGLWDAELLAFAQTRFSAWSKRSWSEGTESRTRELGA